MMAADIAAGLQRIGDFVQNLWLSGWWNLISFLVAEGLTTVCSGDD